MSCEQAKTGEKLPLLTVKVLSNAMGWDRLAKLLRKEKCLCYRFATFIGLAKTIYTHFFAAVVCQFAALHITSAISALKDVIFGPI